ncbi:MAG: dTMP kinase [Anaerolineae bacterium]|nr:MAG: dTMP kinase [Anaerolineae bacterium]
MFITFEGPEGSGKTTQIKPLASFLSRRGYRVLTTREPGGTQIGDQIREILLNRANTAMEWRTEILLFQASRAQLVEQLIRPHLESGGVVLCDRYADSTLAYQGYGYQRDLEALRKIIHFATGGLQPDLTFLLDLDVEAGLSRRSNDGDVNRLDAYELAFHRRVRQGYLELARAEPQRWVVLDATLPPDLLQSQIQQILMERIKQGGEPTRSEIP